MGSTQPLSKNITTDISLTVNLACT